MSPSLFTADVLPVAAAFTLSSPGARSVAVALFFCRWATGLPSAEPADHGGAPFGNHQMVRKIVRLKQVRPGQWQGEMPLAPGWHEYLFLVDGLWVMDPEAASVCPNDAGEFSAVRIVAPESGPTIALRPVPNIRHGGRRTALRRAS